MNKIIGFFMLLMTCQSIWAQEVIATVTVNTPKLQKANPSLFSDLESNIRGYLNERAWTDDLYEPSERIEVTLTLNIVEEITANSFKAELQIQAIRPVYNTSYETIIFSHNDRNIFFQYQETQPIDFSDFGFTDNLSQVLGFYMYIILGFDGDSFALKGGEPYFQRALDVVNSIPQNIAENYDGWSSNKSRLTNRNRYWLIENIYSPKIKNFRQAFYDYHRQGLDIMAEDYQTGRGIILNAIGEVRQIQQTYPNCMLLRLFSTAKSNELVEIFKVAPSSEKREFISLMTKIDPGNSSKYNNINKL